MLDVEGFPIERHWHVAYPKGKQLSVVANAFLNYLQQAAQYVNDASQNHSVTKINDTHYSDTARMRKKKIVSAGKPKAATSKRD